VLGEVNGCNESAEVNEEVEVCAMLNHFY